MATAEVTLPVHLFDNVTGATVVGGFDCLEDDDLDTYIHLESVPTTDVVVCFTDQFTYPDDFEELLDIRWTGWASGDGNIRFRLTYDSPAASVRGEAIGSFDSAEPQLYTQSIPPVGGWTLNDMLSAFAEGYLSLTCIAGDVFMRELWLTIVYRTAAGPAPPWRLFPRDDNLGNSPRLFPRPTTRQRSNRISGTW